MAPHRPAPEKGTGRGAAHTCGAIALEVKVLQARPGAEEAGQHVLRRRLVAHHEQALPVERLRRPQPRGGAHAHAPRAAQLRRVACCTTPRTHVLSKPQPCSPPGPADNRTHTLQPDVQHSGVPWGRQPAGRPMGG